MHLQDFFCSFSKLSLTYRETGFIILSTADDGTFKPAALPVWGRYNGLGGLDDIEDGPNADLILAGFQDLYQQGELKVNFESMGLPVYEIDSLELLVSLFFCAQLHAPDAIQLSGRPLRFALVSAHLAAQLMEQEPQEQSFALKLEDLPSFIFAQSHFGQKIYALLEAQSLKLRCRFGLSLIGLQALSESLKLRSLLLLPPGPAEQFKPAEQSALLLNALEQFADDEVLLEALSEYAAEEPE